MRKFVCLLLPIFIILFSVGVSAGGVNVSTEYFSDDLYDPLPETAPTVALVEGNLDINAKSFVLIEQNTGTVLYQSNEGERLAPASITKIMSLLLIMEAIEDGRLTTDTVITASEHACGMGGSQIWLETGESMTLHELLKAIVIASANDATVAVAEAIAGSEEAFVGLMNERAAELGMSGTHFVNCTGLDADSHETTAYDVAVMSCELLKHKLITEYSTVWMDTLRSGESELVNTNKLVRYYDGCIGLKTGTTSKAGSCLSAAAERDGMTLVAVIMGCADSKSRFEGARKLLDFGFANYRIENVSAELGDDFSLPLKNGEKTSLRSVADGSLCVLTRKTKTEISRETKIFGNISAPIEKGDIVGKVMITVDGEEVGEINITAAESVKRKNLFLVYRWLLAGLIAL